MNKLAPYVSQAVVTRASATPFEFTPEQRKMIRDMYAGGATDGEFTMLMEVAKARRLNPLLKQIYFVKHWDGGKQCHVWAPLVSIDGLRSIAERSGLYDGQDEPEFVEEGGVIRLCRVRVYRKDWNRPTVGVAYWDEYVQTKKDGSLTSMWARGRHFMLAKCAEAVALRKAFPEDTSGLYIPEEMGSDGGQDHPQRALHSQPAELVVEGRKDLKARLSARLSKDTLDVVPEKIEPAPAQPAKVEPKPEPAQPEPPKVQPALPFPGPDEEEGEQLYPPPPKVAKAGGVPSAPPPKAQPAAVEPPAVRTLIPFGKTTKGKYLDEISEKDLEWLYTTAQRNAAESEPEHHPNHRYHDKHVAFEKVVGAELDRRSSGPA